MKYAKWDAIAEGFDAGTFVPANGWEAWEKQAIDEATMIRNALPDSVDALAEIGCGVGRLTPYLALLFPSIVALDTSPACRTVTRRRCKDNKNATVWPADAAYPACDAALVWKLYDSDWTDQEARAHLLAVCDAHPIVLLDHDMRRPVVTLRGDWTLTTADDWARIEHS